MSEPAWERTLSPSNEEATASPHWSSFPRRSRSCGKGASSTPDARPFWRQGTLADVSDWAHYDTLVLLMHGSMIAGSLYGLDRLLERAALLATPGGVLLIDSTDLRDGGSVEPQDDGRYLGELHYQLSAGGVESEIFPQLFVDAETLADHGRQAGWQTEIVWRGRGGRYLAQLTSVTDHRTRHD